MPCAVILTALPVEYLAVRAYLSDLQEEIHAKGTIYERGKFVADGQTWDVGIVEIGAGNSGAALEAERAIAYFNPNVILFVGVAGGIKDVALGDLVASTKVYGYESGKAEETFKSRPEIGLSAYGLEQRARAEARKGDWLQRVSVTEPIPRVFVAPIAAGEKVIASTQSDVYKFIRSNYGDAVAVEMEGFGFLEAARANQRVSAMVIRGISDLIDKKTKSDKAGYQEIASRHASAFAFEILAKFQPTEGSIVEPKIVQNIGGDCVTGDKVMGNKIEGKTVQQNADNAKGWQTVVQGGTAYFGEIHIHNATGDQSSPPHQSFDLPKSNQEKSLQLIEIPNNVPRSGVAKFIGRIPELEKLHTHLQQSNLVSISAVEGMGGVGKTELAIQYTQQHASNYEGGICWLFAREFNIGTQIVGFAQSQLNLKIPEGLELPDQVAFCWRHWRSGDVLLILDDVVNYPRDVEPYLPPVAFTRFKVVMTTRIKFGPPIQSLPLGVLSPEQSLELLTVLIGENRVQSELEIAKTICNWLEHLPLGIELVGRYLIDSTDLSLSTLWSRLQQKAQKRKAVKDDALKLDEEANTATGKRGVEAAFNLSWEVLNSSCQHLGKLLSLFAAAPIPWHLAEAVERKYIEDLNDGNVFEVEEIQKARSRLVKLHLLQLSEQEQQIYRLHSLIREFFRSKLDGESDVETPN